MTVYYKLDHSEPGYLSQMPPRADGAWVKRADYDADLAAARAENERLNNALTEAANQISYLATRLGQAEGRLDASELVGIVEGWKARAEKAEAENERLTADNEAMLAASKVMNEQAEDLSSRLYRAEAERDEARAQVAMAYESAAYVVPKEHMIAGFMIRSISDIQNAIRALTPADAKSALEAYGREKVREGMHLAATIAGMKSAILPHYPDITRGYAQGRSGAREAILAKMEKLK